MRQHGAQQLADLRRRQVLRALTRGAGLSESAMPSRVSARAVPRERSQLAQPRQVRQLARSACRMGRGADAPVPCPAWSPQLLRSTCATFLTCAPGIFGAASLYRSAQQLGHSPDVARRHYLWLVSPPATARTIEAAMGVEAVLGEIVAVAGDR